MEVGNRRSKRLGYKMTGSGEYLVLIPGLGFGRWLFDGQLSLLSKVFTVVTVDNRGVGESEALEEPYSISLMAEDVQELLLSLHIEKAHILGVSLGGFIGQVLALSYPHLVDRLILVSTTGGGEVCHYATPKTLEALMRAQRLEDPMERTMEVFQLTMGEDYFNNHSSEVREKAKEYIKKRPSSQAYQAQSKAGTLFMTEEHRASDLHKIKAKTLILTGDEDRIVPEENAYLLEERIPESRVVLFKGGGHLLMWEDPERFAQEITSFLKER